MSFLKRYGRGGHVQLRPDEVPPALREALMALLTSWFATEGRASYLHSRVYDVLHRRPPETWNYDVQDYLGDIETLVEECAWGEFYAVCEAADEAIVPLHFGDQYNEVRPGFWMELNEILEIEGVPWRMQDGEVSPAFPEEIQGVLDTAAVAAQGASRGVAVHLEKARRYLMPSHRDEENAVKEAVSAVEAAVKDKAGVEDFDDGLRLLKQQRRLKPHWSAAMQTLYQYASREDQIRHGSPELSGLSYEEARDSVGLAAILTQHIGGLPDPARVR